MGKRFEQTLCQRRNMSDKHVKQWSTSSASWGNANHNQVPHHLLKWRKLKCNVKWQGWGATRTVIHCWWKYKMVQVHFIKLLIHCPCSQAIPLLGICPRETKTYVHTCVSLIVALFIIAPNWIDPNVCQLVNG